MQAVNEREMLAAVIRYQQTLSSDDAGRVLELVDPLIRGMLARAATVRMDHDDAYARLRIKIWKALKSYKPGSGRVFSYLNAVVQNCVRTICNEQLKDNREILPLDEATELPVDECRSREEMEDVHYRLMQIRTICTKDNELEAQRWLVRSLIQSDFSLPRHEAVRALRIVFAVDLKQGRLIHDRTVLELRRTLLNGRQRFPSINVAELRDKRERGLLKWKPYLSQAHFEKLVYLLRGLAPVIIGDLIDREVRALNGDGTPERKRAIIRKHLRHALDGFPHSEPLFAKG
jgi:hypothetical protein